MKHSKKRLTKVVDELTTFAYQVGAKKIGIEIEHEENDFKIDFRCDFEHEYLQKVEKLNRLLNPADKNECFDDMYWGLVGDTSSSFEVQLNLIGQMIDHAEVEIVNDKLYLCITKSAQSTE